MRRYATCICVRLYALTICFLYGCSGEALSSWRDTQIRLQPHSLVLDADSVISAFTLRCHVASVTSIVGVLFKFEYSRDGSRYDVITRRGVGVSYDGEDGDISSRKSGLQAVTVRREAEDYIGYYELRISNVTKSHAGIYRCSFVDNNDEVLVDRQNQPMIWQEQIIFFEPVSVHSYSTPRDVLTRGSVLVYTCTFIVPRGSWLPTMEAIFLQGAFRSKPNVRENVMANLSRVSQARMDRVTYSLKYVLEKSVFGGQAQKSRFFDFRFRLSYLWSDLPPDIQHRNITDARMSDPTIWVTPCMSDCKKCMGAKPKCVHCNDMYVVRKGRCHRDFCGPRLCQSGGTCVSGIMSYTCICRSGYSGSKCQIKCGSHCKRCISEEMCTTCKRGFTLGEGACYNSRCGNATCLNGGVCSSFLRVSVCECRNGFSGTVCQTVCPDNCLSCDQAANRCDPRHCARNYGVTATGKCVVCFRNCWSCDYDVEKCTKCAPGYRSNLRKDKCIVCADKLCLNCDTGAQRCDYRRCVPSYSVMSLNGKCMACRDKRCVFCEADYMRCDKGMCMAGYGNHPATGICVQCVSLCGICTTSPPCALAGTITEEVEVWVDPLSCDKGWTLVEGVCKECPENCLKCDRNVAQCDRNSCELGYVLNSTDSQCTKCPDLCERCNSNATRCNSNACELGSWFMSKTGMCKPCLANCLKCDTDSTSCDNGTCRPGFGYNSTTKICHKCIINCVSCNRNALKCDPNSCLPGYRFRLVDHKCEACDPSCSLCTLRKDVCDPRKCNDGYSWSNVTRKCRGCPPNCLHCDPETNRCDPDGCRSAHTFEKMNGACNAIFLSATHVFEFSSAVMIVVGLVGLMLVAILVTFWFTFKSRSTSAPANSTPQGRRNTEDALTAGNWGSRRASITDFLTDSLIFHASQLSLADLIDGQSPILEGSKPSEIEWSIAKSNVSSMVSEMVPVESSVTSSVESQSSTVWDDVDDDTPSTK